MAIEYFCCYHSYLEAMEPLTDAEKGRLFTAMLVYSKTGEVPQLSGNERFIFPMMRGQIDRDNQRYDAKRKKQAENARIRWHDKAESESHGMPPDANACQTMPPDANDAKEKEKTKTKAMAKEKARDKSPHTPRHRYGEYANVLLTDEELGKLQTEFPGDWEARIERLSGYLAQSGKSYKNHLATIRNWARKDREAQAAPGNFKTSNPFLELLEEARDSDGEGDAGGHVGAESGLPQLLPGDAPL